MERILTNAFLTIDLDEPSLVVRYKRLSAPFRDVAEAERVFDEMLGYFDRLDARDWRLFMDVRDGPARNDEAFEELIARYRRRFFARFSRRALLVKTAVGLLQSKRLEGHNVSKNIEFFQDEAEALAFLRAR